MDGILIVNKPKGLTSRDVVNELCKIFNTKKIGHTGTLDPLAEGVLVICIGKATKLVDIITSMEKEYIAGVKLGILTDTLDTDGNILKEDNCILNKENLLDTFNYFTKEYMQKVPIYSAVKINGKKLYEYAREGIDVKLPERLVSIKKIELLKADDSYYEFKTLVSKGTYIRSLIYDINTSLNIIGSMNMLIRTKQGKYKIEESYTLEDIKNNNYKILPIESIIDNNDFIKIDDSFYKIIKNGSIIENKYDKDFVNFMYNDKLIAIYKIYEKDNTKMKPYKMFI